MCAVPFSCAPCCRVSVPLARAQRRPLASSLAVAVDSRRRRRTGTRRVSRGLSQRMCPEMFSKARSRGMGSSEEGEGEGEGSHLMDDHEKPPSRRTSLPRAVPVAGLAVLVLVAWFSYGGSVRGPGLASRHPTGSALAGVCCLGSRVPSCALTAQAPEKGTLRVATWNIAAINNNPFEYWITHDDADYNALMEGVQSFIDQPGACRRPGFRSIRRTAKYEDTALPSRASRDSSQHHADPQHSWSPPATLAAPLASPHLLPGRASRTRQSHPPAAPHPHPHPPRPAAAQASATCLCRRSSRRRCGRSSRR